jgi:superfamily II DNA or RNA helicase
MLKTGEPYWEGMTRQIISKAARDAFLLDTVVMPRHRAGRRILIIGTRVEHMEKIHHRLNTEYMVPTGIIVGKHTDGRKVTAEDRELAQKQPILVASVAIVSKALNIPELDTLMVLSGGSFVNDTFWTQCVGRITREHREKQDPELILIRDRYESKVDPTSDGVFATCVDAACRTLRKRSAEGFRFETIDVELA